MVVKQGGPLLVSAAGRGLSCLLRTACQVPAIVTLSHGTQSQVPVSLVPQSWSLPTPPAPPQASASSALMWSSWGHVDPQLGGWCGLTAIRVLDFPGVLFACQWWPLLPHPDATPAFPRTPRSPSHPPASLGTHLLCRIPGLGYPNCGWNYLLPRVGLCPGNLPFPLIPLPGP